MRWLAAAAILLVAAAAWASSASPLDPLVDEAASRAAQVVTELGGGDVAVTVRTSGGGARAALAARTLGERIVRGVRGAKLVEGDARTFRKAGFARWIDAELRVDGKNVSVALRVRRVGFGWRELLTNRWLRVLTVSRPLDAELRRAVGVPPAGPRRLGRPQRFELDLGAPVLALAAADLDGNGAAELLALTSDEIVLLEPKKSTLVARQRVALVGDAPVPRPREPLGSLLAVDLDLDGAPEIVARSSEHGEGVRLGWRGGTLVAEGGWADYPVCASGREVRSLPLASGQNSYVVPRAGAGCAGHVDAGGTFSLREGGANVAGVGTAFALADLDGDGAPELAASAHRAPGDGDVLTIFGLADAKKPEPRWKSDTLSGGIVAVTSGDFDGDGATDVIFAVRLLGATRTDVWVVR